jgi:hypothetical protein
MAGQPSAAHMSQPETVAADLQRMLLSHLVCTAASAPGPERVSACPVPSSAAAAATGLSAEALAPAAARFPRTSCCW